MTAVAFPLRPPPLALAICGRRWQNEHKVYIYQNLVVEIINSKRQVKRKLGHVVEIRVCRLT